VRKNSKAIGTSFENIFYKLCKIQGIAITRIPDGCRRVSKFQIFQVKTPFDWVLSYCSKSAMIDTKTTQESTFPSSLIKDHQVSALLEHERAGVRAGYVIWFRTTQAVVFFPASVLWSWNKVKESDKKPILLGNLNTVDLKKIWD